MYIFLFDSVDDTSVISEILKANQYEIISLIYIQGASLWRAVLDISLIIIRHGKKQ